VSALKRTTVDLATITTSERYAFKRCPQRWWWQYREGLQPKTTSDAFWFGIAIHLALAEYYALGFKRRPKGAVAKFVAFIEEDDMSRMIRTRPDGTDDAEMVVAAKELGLAMLAGYMAKFRGDKDWDVIYTEHPFQIIIPHPDDTTKDIAMFTSTFDGVYRDRRTRKIWLMEHKTAKSIMTSHLAMDDQGGAYWAVATQVLRSEGILGPKDVIAGIMYNFLRKGLPDERPRDADGYATNIPNKAHYLAAFDDVPDVRQNMTLDVLAGIAEREGIEVLGDRSKNQPPPLFHREPIQRTQRQRRRQILNIANEANAMQMFKDGVLKPYKTPTRDCPGCPFYNMCELDDLGADVDEFRDAMFVVMNPYDRYRGLKSASA
jgi:hypothetical protein